MTRLVNRIFLALVVVGLVVLALRLSLVQSTLENTVGVDPAGLQDTELRELARDAGCGDGVSLWLAVLDRSPDDLEALNAIASCSRRGAGGELVDEASTLLERSRVLRSLPVILDKLELKERIPILRNIEAEAPLGSDDLMDLGRVQHELGDVTGAMRTFERAIRIDPANQSAHLMLARQQAEAGRLSDARASFRTALAGGAAGFNVTTLYAAGLAWPGLAGLLLLGFGGLFAGQASRVPMRWTGDHAPFVRRTLITAVLLAFALLYARYQLTADPVAFVQLGLATAVVAIWTAAFPLRGVLARGAGRVNSVLGGVIRGQLDQMLDRISLPARVGVLITGLVLLVAIAPAIPDVDVAAIVVVLALALVFSTIGSLLLVLLRNSASLRSSLWWLGVAGTLPFLGFFLYLERRTLIGPLHGHAMDDEGVERVLGTLIVWAVGALLATVLARILSRSILEPVQHVLGALEAVKAGDLEVDATLERRDEIGQLGEAVNAMAAGVKERERVARTFRRYMDDRIASHLLQSDVEHGQLVDAVVMFSDLRGFTSMSEHLSPVELVALLNRYFSTIAPIVAAHGGVVDKYMGDGMLAVWGVPESREVPGHEGWSDAELATAASLAMVQAVTALSAALRDEIPENNTELRVGIGLHCGPLVAGPMGSTEHREYTVVGDTVNTAQRIESQARGTYQVLVSGAMAERVGGRFTLVPQELVRVKGKAKELQLYGVE